MRRGRAAGSPSAPGFQPGVPSCQHLLENLAVDLERLVPFEQGGAATLERGLVDHFQRAVGQQSAVRREPLHLDPFPDPLPGEPPQEGRVDGVQAGDRGRPDGSAVAAGCGPAARAGSSSLAKIPSSSPATSSLSASLAWIFRGSSRTPFALGARGIGKPDAPGPAGSTVTGSTAGGASALARAWTSE